MWAGVLELLVLFAAPAFGFLVGTYWALLAPLAWYVPELAQAMTTDGYVEFGRAAGVTWISAILLVVASLVAAGVALRRRRGARAALPR